MRKHENLNLEELFKEHELPMVILDEQKKIIWKNKKFSSLKLLIYFEMILEELDFNKKEFVVTLANNHYEVQCTYVNGFYVLSLFNIYKRDKLQAKLENRRDMSQELLEDLPEAVIIVSENILLVNSLAEKLLGVKKKSLLNCSFNVLFDETNQQVLIDNLSQLEHSKRRQVEFLLVYNKSNKIKWLNISTKLIENANEKLYIHMMKDVTIETLEFQKMSNLASIDRLTNIYNRRKFEELLTEEYNYFKRYSRPLSGIYFDIDFFKKINDTYGHDIGDEVLISVAGLVKSHIRDSDIFARWGGEEFIILLPETQSNDAFTLAEQLRTIIEMHSFNKVKRVTISMGVTQLKKEQLKSFIKRMDLALYEAKHSGRNQVVEK